MAQTNVQAFSGDVEIAGNLSVPSGISGVASSATKLETARTIGGVSFDGTANINLPGVNTDGNQNTSGNAATATALETARTINGTSFDGTANIDILPYINNYNTGDTTCYLLFTRDSTAGYKSLFEDDGLVYDTTNNQLYVGSLQISSALQVADYIYHQGDTDTYIGYPGANQWRVVTGNAERVRVHSNGFFGVRTAAPNAPVHIRAWQNSPPGYNNGVRIQTTGSNYWDIFIWGTTPNLEFGYNNGTKCYMTANGANNRLLNFTGQHRTYIKDIPFTLAPSVEGLIVSSDQNKYIKMTDGVEYGSNAITTNESLPIVSLSTVAYDKKCFGVISTSEDPENRKEDYGNFGTIIDKEYGDTRVHINSLGEGAMWVVNTNGALEAGDYITTSNIAGYGQKQDSEFLANYTVAKITMDCDFVPSTQPVKIIKKELANVNYWVKVNYNPTSEDEYNNLEEQNRAIKIETYYSNENGDITLDEYNALESNVQATYTELTRTIYQEIDRQESKTEREGWDLEVREEMVNVLDEHDQIQWEDDPNGATEKAYKIRYLDANGVITDQVDCVYTAAFVGCTYHCG